MKKEQNREELIESLKNEIEELNSKCADEIAKITEGVNSRILPYGKETELDEIINKYTKLLAPKIVDLEELTGENKE